MNKPHLFLIFNMDKAVRNFGKDGMIDHFVRQGFRCVVFGLKPAIREGLKEDFGDDVLFEDIGPVPLRFWAKLVQRLNTYRWRTRINYRDVLTRHKKTAGWITPFEQWLGKLVVPLPVSFWEKWEEFSGKWPKGPEMLAKYHPVGALIINPINEMNGAINWLKRRGVYTCCMIESWDNLTIRGGLYAHPHDMYVWGELMHAEAVDAHQMPPDRVHIIGLPSFDLYARTDLMPSEEEWRKQMGLPPGVPVVSYATSPALRYQNQDLFVDMILKAREDGRLPKDTFMLVRLHREDGMDVYQRLLAKGNICLQEPDTSLKGYFPDLGQPLMLAATMKYSSVVLNLFSTTVLDSLANGTPVVSIAFDPAAHESGIKEIQDNIRKFLNDKHIKDLRNFNAVSVANTPDEMISHIATYLNNRDHLLENRKACIKAMLGDSIGDSSARFARLLKERIEHHLNRRS